MTACLRNDYMQKRILAKLLILIMIFSAYSSVKLPVLSYAAGEVYNVNGHFEVEAESLTYSSDLNKVALDDASGGYALQRTGSMNSSSSQNDITLNVNIQSEGRYAFYLKLKTNSSYITYYTKLVGEGGKTSFMSNVKTGEFIYFPIDSYYLNEGNHTLVFTYRHCGYYIDKLVLTNLSHETMFENGGYNYTLMKNNSYNLSYELPTVLKNNIHPRLIIEKDKINSIKANLTHPQNKDRYNRLLDAANKNYSNCLLNTNNSDNKNHDYLDYIEANAFLYALNKNTSNAKKAVDGIKDYLKTYNASYSSLTESREAGNLIFRASLVYDWCHDYLTRDDKNFIINQCLLLFTASEHGRDGIHALNAYNSDHGEEYVLIKNMAGFAVATFDEIPYYYNNICRRIVEEFIPSRNFRYENSDFNQMGDNYGIFRSGADSFLKLILSNLGMEDLITSNQAMQAYQPIYRRNPNGDFMRDGDCYSLPFQGGYQVPSGLTALLFVQSLMNSDPYLKGEYFNVTANAGSNNLADSSISDAMYLALNDVTVSPKQKNDLPLSKYFGDKSGVMVARTSWDSGINSNTMTVSMKVSENNMGSHGHSDSGHFYIYYKGPLAVDSGIYEPTTGNKQEHLNNYYRQTVAHNSVLIGGKGQKGITDLSTYNAMVNNSHYGEVLGYDFGDNLNKPDYTYLKGDLTPAYNGVAEEYTRSFMFYNFFDEVYPGALIVFDKITSTNASDAKTYLLHSQNEPEISGSTVTIKNTTDYGYNGRLTNQVLLPQSNLAIDKVEGFVADGVEYEASHRHTNGAGDESGNYRVEISSSSPQKTEYILNVLQVSENSDSISVIPSELIELTDFYGVKIKDRIALFSKSRNRTDADVEFAVNGNQTQKIAVCDLKEGTWQITKDNSEYTTVNVSSNGGVAYFEGNEGTYKLSYVNSQYTDKNLGTLNNLVSNPDSIPVIYNDGTLPAANFANFSSEIIKHNGEIMVPLTEASKLFGATVTENDNTFSIKKDGKELIAYKDSRFIIYNGKNYMALYSTLQKDGVWYVHPSSLSPILKWKYQYNTLSGILYLTYTNNPENVFVEISDAACDVQLIQNTNATTGDIEQFIRISGFTGNEMYNKMITIGIIDKNLDKSNAANYSTVKQIIVDKSGSYSIDIPFYTGGEYIVRIKTEASSEPVEVPLTITDANTINSFMNGIKNHYDKTELNSQILAKGEEMGFDLEIYKLLSNEKQEEICSAVLNNVKDKTLTEIKGYFNEKCSVVSVSDQSDSDIIFKALDHYKDIYSFGDDREYTLFNGSNSSLKLYAVQKLGSMQFSAPGDIKTSLYENVVLYDIYNIEAASQIVDKIETYSSYITIANYSAFNNMFLTQKSNVAQYLYNNQADSIEEFNQNLDYVITNYWSIYPKAEVPSSPAGGGNSRPSSTVTLPVVTPSGVAGGNTNQSAPSFEDLNEALWAKDAILYLLNNKVVNGKEEGKFCPNDNVTRAEFVKMLMLACKITADGSVKKEFTDVPASHWAYEYVNIASSRGLVNGISVAEFGAANNMSREDMATLGYRILTYFGTIPQGQSPDSKFTDFESFSDYASDAILMLNKYGYINGYPDNSFKPKNTVTRAEAAQFVYNLVKER